MISDFNLMNELSHGISNQQLLGRSVDGQAMRLAKPDGIGTFLSAKYSEKLMRRIKAEYNNESIYRSKGYIRILRMNYQRTDG